MKASTNNYQLKSQFNENDFSWTGKAGAKSEEKIFGSFYFSTNSYELSQDDVVVVNKLIKDLFILFGLGHAIKIKLCGYADIKGRDSLNDALSFRRMESVRNQTLSAIERRKRRYRHEFELGGMVYKRINSAYEAHGRKNASRNPKNWAQDRRVDIFVKIVPINCANDLHNEKNTGAKLILRFKAFCPYYVEWVKRGLHYLIEQEEENNTTTIEMIIIRTWDVDKVHDLLKKLMDKEDYKYLEVELSNSHLNNREIISSYYNLQMWNKVVYFSGDLWEDQLKKSNKIQY